MRFFVFFWTSLLGAALFSPSAHAQSVTVRAFVDADRIGRQEYVDYSIEIAGERFGQVTMPDAPGTLGLALVSPAPSTQRSTTIANGLMQQTLRFTWRYRPLREGTARIDGATVQIGKELRSTDPITIRVEGQAQKRTRPSARDPWGDPVDDAPTTIEPSDLFIQVTPSKTSAYQNEGVMVVYKLFFRPGFQFRQLRLADSWDAVGFWREEIDVDSHPVPQTVVYNGERYQTIELKRVALFATRSGALTVDGLAVEADVIVPQRSRDPFSMFGRRGQLETTRITSPPLNLRITPLPDGAPGSFTGAVGRYRLATSYDQTALEVGEATRLKVSISGTGNLSTLEPPRLDAPGAIEVFDPTTTLDISRTAAGVSGSRSFEYALVPRANGTFPLPAVAFSYFDPSTRAYQTLTGDGTTLVVTGEVAPGTDLLPTDALAGLMPEADGWVLLHERPLHRRAWPYALLALPLLALIGLTAARRHRDHLAANVGLARSRSAHPLARKHLKEASLYLENGDARGYYDALEKALLGFVGARLNLAERGLTRAALDAHLREAGVAPDAIDGLRGLLERCDQVRFAPVVPPLAQQQADREAAAALIVDLDQQVSTRPA